MGPSSPSTPSIILSMGEDFVDKEERSHGVRQSQLPQDAHDSSSMLSTMLKYGGGRTTLYYEHREGR